MGIDLSNMRQVLLQWRVHLLHKGFSLTRKAAHTTYQGRQRGAETQLVAVLALLTAKINLPVQLRHSAHPSALIPLAMSKRNAPGACALRSLPLRRTAKMLNTGEVHQD